MKHLVLMRFLVEAIFFTNAIMQTNDLMQCNSNISRVLRVQILFGHHCIYFSSWLITGLKHKCKFVVKAAGYR